MVVFSAITAVRSEITILSGLLSVGRWHQAANIFAVAAAYQRRRFIIRLSGGDITTLRWRRAVLGMEAAARVFADRDPKCVSD